MHFTKYYNPVNEMEIREEMVHQLELITDWNRVQPGELILSDRAQSYLYVDVFREPVFEDTVNRDKPTHISYLNRIDNKVYKTLLSENEKWYYWNEDLAINLSLNTQDKQGKNLLMSAISNNDYALAEKLINLGINVNHESNVQSTALCLAILNHNLRLSELLIKHGAIVSVVDSFEQNLFHYACHYIDINGENTKTTLDVMEYLLKFNLPINKKDDEGVTPLTLVCSQNGDSAIVEYLLNIGADIDAIGVGGTALIEAIYNNSLTTLRILVANGADLNLSTLRHPMHFLQSHEACQIIEPRMDEISPEGLQLFQTKRLELLFNT